MEICRNNKNFRKRKVNLKKFSLSKLEWFGF